MSAPVSMVGKSVPAAVIKLIDKPKASAPIILTVSAGKK